MDFIFDILFLRFITRFLGLRTRFLFFKIFNKDLKMSTLKENEEDSFYHDVLNALVGLTIFSLISFLIAYIVN